VRGADLVCRLGGDEFAIIQMGGFEYDGLHVLADRIVGALKRPFDLEGISVEIGASLGAAIAPLHANAAKDLIARADLALYDAKASGRGTWRLFNKGLDQRAMERKELERDLASAIANGELWLAYQPEVNIETAKIVSYEALLRWEHPVRGRVSPVDFIPIAEQSGIIGDMGYWVLEQACRDACAWPKEIGVSVNVSAKQLVGRDLAEDVLAALELTGLDPWRLTLELTETSLFSTSTRALATLEGLRQKGVRISIDDFGTGYSSLSYLSNLSVDEIKVDRSFVAASLQDRKSQIIITAIVGMAHSLGLMIVAEGVETVEQADYLRSLGCSHLQGYLFGKPQAAESLNCPGLGDVTEIAA